MVLFFQLNIFFFSNNYFINSFYIYFNINWGWLIRFIHRNLTSILFILIFSHITRNLIYRNYINSNIWLTGIIIFIIIIINSFIGYSLISSQISYWARIVITNFISLIPFIGNNILIWIWGNFYISNIIINRFFSIHFLLPIIIIIFIFIHFIILHNYKSTNPIRLNNNLDLINLSPNFIFKDIIIFLILIYLIIILNLIYPTHLNNYDNFNKINYFKTPKSIEPEWYFLFFYSILRSIDNKYIGIIIIILSIIYLFIIPFYLKNKILSINFNIIKKYIIFYFIFLIILISWIGIKIQIFPYKLFNLIFIINYFFILPILIFINYLINFILYL